MKRWLLLPLFLLPLFLAGVRAEDMDRARGLVGILPLPEVFGSAPCEPFEAKDIPLYPSPQAAEPLGRIHVTQPWRFPPEGGCEGLEVSVSFETLSPNETRLPTLEFGYETPGAIVLRRDGEWFEIALDAGRAWVHVPGVERYLPVETLLKGGLTYLRGNGQTRLRVSPDGGELVWSAGPELRANPPVSVLAVREVAGRLWVQVRLLDMDPCTGEKTTLPPLTGWLPFHGESGLPTVWFYARGC